MNKSHSLKLKSTLLPTDTQPKFISSSYLHDKVILPSFHRCGNTLIRELLEGITNILTGSDDPHTNFSLLPTGEKDIPNIYLNFDGTYIVDDSVWVYKTHYPIRKGKGTYGFNKILLITRNPYDAIESLFNMYMTNTHTDSIKESMFLKYSHDWEEFTREQSVLYSFFHKYWIEKAEKERIPLLIVQYEELIKNMKESMVKVMKFLFEKDIPCDSYLDVKINDYLNNRRLIYLPRKGTAFHSFSKFSSQMKKVVLMTCLEWIEYAGYAEDIEYLDDINTDEISTIKDNLMKITNEVKINKNQISKLILDYELYNDYMKKKSLRLSRMKNTILTLFSDFNHYKEVYPYNSIVIPYVEKILFYIKTDKVEIDMENINKIVTRLSKVYFLIIEKEKVVDMRRILSRKEEVDVFLYGNEKE